MALFSLFGESWLAELSATSILLFLWLFAVMLWCAFGVVEEAYQLAQILDERPRRAREARR
jgi:Ca2+:H+ antiporter